MVNIREDERLNILNHSSAHLLAHAVKRLYPEAKFWVGPVIEDGFYYDMDLGDQVLTEEDLPKIESMMRKIAKEDKRITREVLTKQEALEIFKDDSYKIDIINNLEDYATITAYRQAEFIDLCRGPHVETTKKMKYFKLLKVSGAYWKGDSKNKMLQRVYGITFETEEDLNQYLEWLEAAKARDHKKLGKELELFMMSEFGPGFPFWLPNGMTLRHALDEYYYNAHIKRGYVLTQTPTMLNKELWEVSGHWENYRENMYTSTIDDREFAIKPMNCPGGMLVYKNGLHSYRDLPIRLAEMGHVHRHEASGALNGLFRVRSFTQDDAHLFMREDQLQDEIVEILDFIDEIYSTFGLSYSIELSTRPEDKYIGDIAVWDRSEQALKEACMAAGVDFKINEGDGAFYGPKLDFKVRDSLNRVWQCGTVQLDMNLPERFDLTYVAEDGKKKRPIMLHRAIFGSIERFIGILIEHFAGGFPLWMAPKQIEIIPVNTEFHMDYANEVCDLLLNKGIRAHVDGRNEKLGYRLREAQKNKIPLQLIIGDKEIEDRSVNVRRYGERAQNPFELDGFMQLVEAEIKSRYIHKIEKD
ncbi:threonine--tRNA ligase [Erysipelothrix piscisicarius]|uniref:Threonine--tRNA ligase n=1 Tax=Erysipelothrix piscisicarius TaxID=2485784 RepID=A0A3S8RN11_9FIRM|nr:threonine--tRNA ligase [Erysipelothrix piscisicarius]AZK44213.1 threonine--tRNA ligase [Erysipelothrix piscisicarius]